MRRKAPFGVSAPHTVPPSRRARGVVVGTAVVVGAALAGGVAWAGFTSSAPVGDSSVSAGTLTLEMASHYGNGSPAPEAFDVRDVRPGTRLRDYVLTLTNHGSLPGDLSLRSVLRPPSTPTPGDTALASRLLATVVVDGAVAATDVPLTDLAVRPVVLGRMQPHAVCRVTLRLRVPLDADQQLRDGQVRVAFQAALDQVS